MYVRIHEITMKIMFYIFKFSLFPNIIFDGVVINSSDLAEFKSYLKGSVQHCVKSEIDVSRKLIRN